MHRRLERRLSWDPCVATNGNGGFSCAACVLFMVEFLKKWPSTRWHRSALTRTANARPSPKVPSPSATLPPTSARLAFRTKGAAPTSVRLAMSSAGVPTHVLTRWVGGDSLLRLGLVYPTLPITQAVQQTLARGLGCALTLCMYVLL